MPLVVRRSRIPNSFSRSRSSTTRGTRPELIPAISRTISAVRRARTYDEDSMTVGRSSGAARRTSGRGRPPAAHRARTKGRRRRVGGCRSRPSPLSARRRAPRCPRSHRGVRSTTHPATSAPDSQRHSLPHLPLDPDRSPALATNGQPAAAYPSSESRTVLPGVRRNGDGIGPAMQGYGRMLTRPAGPRRLPGSRRTASGPAP